MVIQAQPVPRTRLAHASGSRLEGAGITRGLASEAPENPDEDPASSSDRRNVGDRTTSTAKQSSHRPTHERLAAAYETSSVAAPKYDGPEPLRASLEDPRIAR